MKLIQKLALATASVAVFTSVSATKVAAFDYTFTQSGWNKVIPSTLSGSFSGTPGGNGDIGLRDLTAFSANFSADSNTTHSWGLENLSDFTYNTVNGFLGFRAFDSVTETNVSEPCCTVSTTTGYILKVNSEPIQPSEYSINLRFSVSGGVGNNLGTIFSTQSNQVPQVVQENKQPKSIPEPMALRGFLIASGIGACLIKKKKSKV